jgi:DNA mismatch repair protein MutH
MNKKKQNIYYPPESDEGYKESYKMKKLIIEKGKAFKINKHGKYLLVMPSHANVNALAPAIAKFFDPVPVFVLAVNDVNDVKLTELVEEADNK